MTVLNIDFTTIRAAVASVAREIKQTTAETKITFGPGFDITLSRDREAK